MSLRLLLPAFINNYLFNYLNFVGLTKDGQNLVNVGQCWLILEVKQWT